jgi:hypothetical protein
MTFDESFATLGRGSHQPHAWQLHRTADGGAK